MDSNTRFSKLASLIRGLTNTASLGFDDEAVGGIKALYQAATDPNKHLGDIPDLYSQNRDKFRADSQAAQEQNPNSYMAGQGTGLAASMLLPGSAVKASGMGSAALMGALYGGAAGAGNSESNSLPGLASDTVQGAALGGVVAPIANVGASKLFPKLGAMMPKSGQRGAGNIGTAVEEAVSGLKFAPQDAADAAQRISNRVQQKVENDSIMRNSLSKAQKVYEDKIRNMNLDPDKTNIIEELESIKRNLK